MKLTKLLEVQKKLKPIIKDAKNPFYKSMYADINSVLADIRPILTECGVVLTQPIECPSEETMILKSCLYDAETGELLNQSAMLLPRLEDVQKMGAAITYYRRYSLVSLLALEQEDDDGNTASNSKPVQAKPVMRDDNNVSNHYAYIIKNLPPCKGCGAGRKHVQSGTTQAGKIYEGFFPCITAKDKQTPDCRKDIIKESIAEDIVRNNQEYNNL